MRNFVLFAVAIATASGFSAPAAAQPAAEFVTGVEYQQGDYGTSERIETITVRNTARVQSGRVQLYLSLPWHRVEAPGNIVAGGGGLLGLPVRTDPQRPTARIAREGIGDLRVGGGYTLAAPGGVALTLNGEAKLPTASSSRGLGTGEPDFTVGSEASRTMGSITPFIGLSYTSSGNNESSRRDSSIAARGGVAVQLSPALRGHVSYGQARGLSPFIENERQLSTGIDARLTDSLSLGVSGGVGLTESSPNVGAAVRLGWRLF